MVVTPTGLSRFKVVAASIVHVVPFMMVAIPPFRVTPAPPIVTAPVARTVVVVPEVRNTPPTEERVAEVAPENVATPPAAQFSDVVVVHEKDVPEVTITAAADEIVVEVAPEKDAVVGVLMAIAVVALIVNAAVLIVHTAPALIVVPRVVVIVWTFAAKMDVPVKVWFRVVPAKLVITPVKLSVGPPAMVVEVREVRVVVVVFAVNVALVNVEEPEITLNTVPSAANSPLTPNPPSQ